MHGNFTYRVPSSRYANTSWNPLAIWSAATADHLLELNKYTDPIRYGYCEMLLPPKNVKLVAASNIRVINQIVTRIQKLTDCWGKYHKIV